MASGASGGDGDDVDAHERAQARRGDEVALHPAGQLPVDGVEVGGAAVEQLPAGLGRLRCGGRGLLGPGAGRHSRRRRGAGARFRRPETLVRS